MVGIGKHAGGRPPIWGQGTRYTSVRVPVGDLEWLDTWAKAQGYSRSKAMVLFLRNVRREGKAGLRAVESEGELQKEREAHEQTLRIRDQALRERDAERAKNRALRDYLGGLVQRIRARIPSNLWSRLELRDARAFNPGRPEDGDAP